jgi:hypothetical protein
LPSEEGSLTKSFSEAVRLLVVEPGAAVEGGVVLAAVVVVVYVVAVNAEVLGVADMQTTLQFLPVRLEVGVGFLGGAT